MWPIPTLKHKLVSVIFSPDALVCSWIEKTNNGSSPLLLRAYKRYPLNNLELEHCTIFNPTIIKKYISSFLQQYDCADAFVTFVLRGPGVTEQFVAMPTSTPHRTDFGIASNSRSLLWEYRYVYSNDHGQFVFYVYSVPRSLVLQYQLLAIAAQCNLITMTTQTMALLSAYKNIFGTAFRRSQLAVDMMRCNNTIDDLIGIDTVNRMISGAGHIVGDERLSVAAAAGLFCSERLE